MISKWIVTAGREVLVARLGEQELLLGEKINPVPVPEKWLKRVGNYEIINPDGDFLLQSICFIGGI